jgi:hypothetical protein
MRRTVASVLLLGLLLAAPARADSHAEAAARVLESDPVYVHPRAAGRLTVAEQGRVRIAIVQSALGRVKVAVVPAGVVAGSGGVEELASQLDRMLAVRGTLIVVAGPAYRAVTSYPRSDAAASALRAAVNRRRGDRLAAELVAAIPRIARVDPGPSGDLRQDSPGPVQIPDGDDFLDDIGDAFRLGVLIVATAVALPFVVLAVFLIARARRRRARDAEVLESGDRSANDELVAFGDEIRALDLDTSMPGADRAALAEYEQALALYDQANELVSGDPTPYRVEQARAAIAAGRRHVAAAAERLG